VVEVVVDHVEVPAGAQVLEADPGEHADDVVAPVPGADEQRRVREPEVVVLEDLEAAPVPEDRGGLALGAAEAAEVDPVVVLEVFEDVLVLAVQALLCEQDGGLLALEDRLDEGAALVPGARRGVAAFVAEVEGDEVELVAPGCADEGAAEGLFGLGGAGEGAGGDGGGADREACAEDIPSTEDGGHGTSISQDALHFTGNRVEGKSTTNAAYRTTCNR
jgi:hypothetical protein